MTYSNMGLFNRMLKKSSSTRGPLFGLSGLFSFFGLWLDETNQMIQMNKTNQINQIGQR
jgi:hypothetical protein